MNLNVTDQNLYLFIPGKISLVATIYAAKNNCSIVEALKRFYASPVYARLRRESTKYWHLGPVALYQEWTANP